MTNNFVGLNLSKFEKAILHENCILKLFRMGSNIHVVRLENAEGNLITSKEGFRLIPTLEKANQDYLKDFLCFKEIPSFQVIDSHLDQQIISGSTLTIKKNGLYLLGILKSWDGTVIVRKQSNRLMNLLVNIELHFNAVPLPT